MDTHTSAIQSVQKEINRQARTNRRADAKPKPHELKLLKATRIAAVAAVGAAVLSFFSLIAFATLTLKSDGTARIAANAAKETAEQMKGQVAIMKIQMSPKLKLDNAVPVPFDEKSSDWKITPQWKNTGQGDARDFSNWDALAFFPGNTADTFDFTRQLVALSPPTTMPPEEVATQATLMIPREFITNFFLRDGKIMFWGYVQWHDTFPGSQLHFRHYCFAINFIMSKGRPIATLPAYFRPECNTAN